MSSEVTVIQSRTKVFAFDYRELWEFRDLLVALSLRNLKIRYKQTVIGVAWAAIQPLLTMVIYTLTFSRVAKVPSEGVPYPVFSFSGLVFWTLFSTSLSNAADSLVSNEGILKKVYFPRLLAPLAATAAPLADFACSGACLGLIMAYYRIAPSPWFIVLVPLLALWTVFCSAGLGWLLASLNAQYRDVRYALPFFVQLLVFVSPVIYPTRIFGKYSWILALNPMTGVIEAARYTLLGAGSVTIPVMATSLATSLGFLVVGYLYFRHTERLLADVL